MKFKTAVNIFLFTVLLSGPVLADKIRIATGAENPPFNMKNKHGQLIGFEVDIARALCYQMQAECEFIEQEEEMIPALLENEYDAVIASIPVSAELQKQVSFSESYYSNYLYLIGQKDSGMNVSVHGLQGKKIGVTRSGHAASYLQEHHGGSASIELYENQQAAFAALKSGDLDAVLVGAYDGYNWLINPDSSGFDMLGDKVDVNDISAIALRKDDLELKQKLDQALSAIQANGTFKRISRNYFPFDVK